MILFDINRIYIPYQLKLYLYKHTTLNQDASAQHRHQLATFKDHLRWIVKVAKRRIAESHCGDGE